MSRLQQSDFLLPGFCRCPPWEHNLKTSPHFRARKFSPLSRKRPSNSPGIWHSKIKKQFESVLSLKPKLSRKSPTHHPHRLDHWSGKQFAACAGALILAVIVATWPVGSDSKSAKPMTRSSESSTNSLVQPTPLFQTRSAFFRTRKSHRSPSASRRGNPRS